MKIQAINSAYVDRHFMSMISLFSLLLLNSPSACAAAGNEVEVLIAQQNLSTSTTVSKKVLSPDQFDYPMKLGYSAAQKYPDVIKKLFCYCGCDKTDKHESLMDCYVSTHGAYCQICLEEAIKAQDMRDKKASIRQIQDEVDKSFAKLYPLPSPTPALIKYRDELKKAGLEPSQLNTAAPKNAKVGACCGDHSKKKK